MTHSIRLPPWPAATYVSRGASTNKRVQEYHELGYNGWNLQPGDIMCWRDAKRFRHMDLVYSFSGSTLTTIDGNYSLSEPITKRTWDMNTKINAKDYAHVYMHVDV